MALYKRNVAVALLCLCLLVSAVAGSRSFIAGSMVALLLWLYCRKQQQPKLFLLMACAAVVSFALLVCMVKTDSSRGRLLIYKVSWRMFCDHWLQGVGIGCFDSRYLLHQAAYFSEGGYTERELLLADNTYYAFNDYWQWIVETGIVGGGLLLGVLFFLCREIRRVLAYDNATWVQCAAATTLMVLFTAALFTHIVSSVAGVTALLLGCAGLLHRQHQHHVLLLNRVFTAAALLPLLFAWGRKAAHADAVEQYKEADELSRYGYHKTALDIYSGLYAAQKGEVAFLGGYAQACERYGKYQGALELYQQLLLLHPSNTTCYKMGECYRYLKNPLAEYYYRLAVNMVPNRFVTREALFSYYVEMRCYTDAKQTGKQLLHMPVKVPSDRVRQLLAHVEEQMRLMN